MKSEKRKLGAVVDKGMADLLFLSASDDCRRRFRGTGLAEECIEGARSLVARIENRDIIERDIVIAQEFAQLDCGKHSDERKAFACRGGVRGVMWVYGQMQSGAYLKPFFGGLGIIRNCSRSQIDPKRPHLKVCLIARKTGKVIGRHETREGALSQERAIQIAKHRRKHG